MDDDSMLRSTDNYKRVFAQQNEYARLAWRMISEERRRYFVLGWCAGLLTALLMLVSVKALGCGDLPAPDETIEQIKAETL